MASPADPAINPSYVEAEGLAGEAKDAEGARVVLPARVWNGKLLRDHPELEAHQADVLRAVSEPDHVAVDPVYADRRRNYLKRGRAEPLAAGGRKL